jgi:hypothetical protein
MLSVDQRNQTPASLANSGLPQTPGRPTLLARFTGVPAQNPQAAIPTNTQPAPVGQLPMLSQNIPPPTLPALQSNSITSQSGTLPSQGQTPLFGFQSVTIGSQSTVSTPNFLPNSQETPGQRSPVFSPQPGAPLLPSQPALSTAQRIQDRLIANRARQKNGKHLVMDLDETLVHTFDPKDNFEAFAEDLTDEQRSRIYVLRFPSGESLWGYVRPYAEDFLRVAFEEFDTVGVWSAGTSYYVNLIVQILFKDQQPAYVMSRDQCNELVLKKEPMPCRFKPLEILYHRYPDHNEANTVIVDDRHDICSLNCMNNIRIPEYLLNHTSYPTLVDDVTLLILAEWFQSPEFRSAPDVRKIKGRSPFKIE